MLFFFSCRVWLKVTISSGLAKAVGVCVTLEISIFKLDNLGDTTGKAPLES